MWQEIIVGFCVLAATAFLIRQWLWPSQKNTACGGCNGCNKNDSASCAHSDQPEQKSAPANK